ncbi:hypothetical protein [Elizabethkingia miricola]|uniref:hypothetical protein n=1 Tax=Elizabethkingia miricola TaxID=172045 RepID=UPI000999A932|nr:hypothetical protein [Elizabethkingia miricola]OPC32652.1 hypothetical protein BAX99_10540 [Elizabethkingia miricola]
MIILQIGNSVGLNIMTGFWDNFVWPIAVAAFISISALLKKKLKLVLKKEVKPIIKLSLNSDNNISFVSDNDILSKLTLIKQMIRQNNSDGYELEIIPTFKTKNFDRYQKKEFQLKLKSKASEIKCKFEILLFRSFDFFIENSPESLKIIIEKILEKQPSNVSGLTKLDIYRTIDPKITFPIYLTQKDFETICKKENKTIEEMKQILCIPTMCGTSIFPNEIIWKEIIPALVNEIYRIKTNSKFDINIKGWDLIISYEVGLG